MKKSDFIAYIEEQYGVSPDYPWEKHPEFLVFRHRDSKKWFAVVMTIPAAILGLEKTTPMDVVNVKCDPTMVGSLLREKGYYPAYHMNKNKWITVGLEENHKDHTLLYLLDQSFSLTRSKKSMKCDKMTK